MKSRIDRIQGQYLLLPQSEFRYCLETFSPHTCPKIEKTFSPVLALSFQIIKYPYAKMEETESVARLPYILNS